MGEIKKLNGVILIDFESIDENEVMNKMKIDFEVFLAALVQMKMVDNFYHSIPSGLASFAEFFFSNLNFIYRNHNLPNKIYTEFLKWLKP